MACFQPPDDSGLPARTSHPGQKAPRLQCRKRCPRCHRPTSQKVSGSSPAPPPPPIRRPQKWGVYQCRCLIKIGDQFFHVFGCSPSNGRSHLLRLVVLDSRRSWHRHFLNWRCQETKFQTPRFSDGGNRPTLTPSTVVCSRTLRRREAASNAAFQQRAAVGSGNVCARRSGPATFLLPVRKPAAPYNGSCTTLRPCVSILSSPVVPRTRESFRNAHWRPVPHPACCRGWSRRSENRKTRRRWHNRVPCPGHEQCPAEFPSASSARRGCSLDTPYAASRFSPPADHGTRYWQPIFQEPELVFGGTK